MSVVWSRRRCSSAWRRARPILTIAPRGELWDLLDGYPGDGRFVPGDVDGIARWLASAIRDHKTGRFQAATNWDASAYNREHEAGQLARFLNSLILSGTTNSA